MNTEDFVRELRRHTLVEGMEFYQEFFENQREITSGDSYWRDATTLYSNLDPNQQEVLLEIVRQVTVDTVACILGIIDGVSFFANASGQFQLTVDGDKLLSGDLQEQFFIQEQSETGTMEGE